MKKSEIGIIVTFFGLLLFLGNIGGFFRTFPFAGGLTMGLGSALMREN